MPSNNRMAAAALARTELTSVSLGRCGSTVPNGASGTSSVPVGGSHEHLGASAGEEQGTASRNRIGGLARNPLVVTKSERVRTGLLSVRHPHIDVSGGMSRQ